jgi:uncharacterized protein
LVEPIEIALLALAVLLTSILSGVFAMGGGVLLLAVLLNLLPVTQAMIYHGMIQFFSNGFRAILSFRSINYKIMSFYIAGSLIGASLLFQVVYAPKKGPLLFTVGLLTLFGPHLKFVNFDITSKLGALVSGVIISWLNTLIGATGPILNMFFLKSDLSRFEVIATKSAIQTVAHVIKVVFYLGLFSKMPTQNFDQF